MNNTPQRLKNKWAKEPKPECARKGSECRGRMTKEHALIYAGKQVQELWAIIDLCWYHHLGAGLDKQINRCIALARATAEDLAKYPKAVARWMQELEYCKTLDNK